MAWPSMRVELASFPARDRFEFEYEGDSHVLSYCAQGERARGETRLPDVERSERLDLGGRMVYVPRGARLTGWSDARRPSRWINIYLGPDAIPDGEDGPAPLRSRPLLHFADGDLAQTARKLGRLVPPAGAADRLAPADVLYAQTLAAVMMAELQRALSRGAGATSQVERPGALRVAPEGTLTSWSASPPSPRAAAGKGGLGPWRERKLQDYIHAHLAEPLALSHLAEVAGLSAYHLARAFTRSFGMPPHAYVTARRIERACELLDRSSLGVTRIALEVGFNSASQFSTRFRDVVGASPTAWRARHGGTSAQDC